MSEPSPPTPQSPRSIRLGLSPKEWAEFQDCVKRHYRGVEDFFTLKALELIALGREEKGRLPN